MFTTPGSKLRITDAALGRVVVVFETFRNPPPVARIGGHWCSAHTMLVIHAPYCEMIENHQDLLTWTLYAPELYSGDIGPPVRPMRKTSCSERGCKSGTFALRGLVYSISCKRNLPIWAMACDWRQVHYSLGIQKLLMGVTADDRRIRNSRGWRLISGTQDAGQ